MAIMFNYAEFTRYLSAVTVFKNQYYDFLKDFLKEMASRVISRAKPRTPVDTGNLRRSFILGDVNGYGENISVDILNGADYASYIEYGHRIVVNGVEVGWYDGRFMLKTSVDEIQRQMPERYQREFTSFCSKMGIV